MVRAHGKGATFQASCSRSVFNFVGFGFVDDVDLITADNMTSIPHTEILSQMQTNLDLWEQGLRTSGGALSADKSQWTFIDFSWKNGYWVYMPQSQLPGQLLMQDVSGKCRQLTHLEPWEAE